MPTMQSKAHWCWAIGVLLPCAAACGDDGDDSGVSAAFESYRRLNRALCECSTEPDCGPDLEELACREGIALRHADALSSWAACANDVFAEVEPCVAAAACDESALDTCMVGREFDEVCEIPEAVEQAFEADVDRECPSEIECSDQTIALGNYCNGVPDCADGSDEDFCESEDGF
jgi:hypothetical protein